MTSQLHAEVELEVPFHDVDALRIVWHGHYYKYMEIARTQLLRRFGLDGEEVLALGFNLLVIETKCRYAFPLRYGDRFRVRAKFADLDYRITINYEITNLTHQRRAARGKTVLVTTDLEGNLFYETPSAIKSRLTE